MKIIRRSEFKSAPWKNGGGITHEIARLDGPHNILWRLSIADVSQDGPFSIFEGLTRSLTVITGQGMNLVDATGNLAHEVAPMQTITFSGEEALTGILRNGPCEDFNLIYDPRIFEAHVDQLNGGRVTTPSTIGATIGLLCIEGEINCGKHILDRHDFAYLDADDAAVELSSFSKALRVTLKNV